MSAAQLKDLGNGKIAVQGELTFDSVAGVLQASRTILNGSKDLCVDLSEVTRSDSSGVAFLGTCRNTSKQKFRDYSDLE